MPASSPHCDLPYRLSILFKIAPHLTLPGYILLHNTHHHYTMYSTLIYFDPRLLPSPPYTLLSTQIYIRYILLKFQDDFPLLLVLETKEANQFLSLLSVEPNALKLWQWDNSITPGYT